ncbi:MAG: hypothetical protein J3K34DRAFT_475598 [Monoraphidium minutum]|nr:MAG: hypothetical protein J3K34DRAFT_475598 [Monoraphidium minutum]
MSHRFDAADVVDAVIERAERRALADWQRSGTDMTQVAGTSPNWFPQNRSPFMRFEAMWCEGGVIAQLVLGVRAAGGG